MTWSNGMELINGSGNIAFAEHNNQIMMANRGNYVLSGLIVTANATSDLSTTANDVDISAGSCLNNNTHRASISASNLDLSTEYATLSSGESLSVFIYISTAGVISKVSGTIATTGQQSPPSIPDNTVVLALVTLTYGDTTVDSVDIEDWQIENSSSMAMNDNEKSYYGNAGDFSIYHDSTNSYIENITGSFILKTISGHMYNDVDGSIFIRDIGAGSVTLSQFDTNARTYTIGASADPMGINHYGAFYNKSDNTGIYTGASNDLRIYHNGSNTHFINNTGVLLFQSFGDSIILDTISNILIRDIDTGFTTLFDFDTNNRNFIIGSATDYIDYFHYGAVKILDVINDSIEANITESNLDNDNMLSVEGEYTTDHYYPLLMLSNDNNNQNIPKVGIWSKLTGSGSMLLLGTSDSYTTGITVTNLQLTYQGYVYNPLDNAGYYTGVGNDLRIYHSGTHSYITNATGTLHYINNAVSQDIIFRTARAFYFQDGSNTNMMYLDNTAQTLNIGASANTIEINHYGNYQMWNSTTRMTLVPGYRSASKIYNYDSGTTAYYDINIGHSTNGSASSLFYDASVSRWGIGTTTPSYTFDVTGTIRATSSIYANSNINFGTFQLTDDLYGLVSSGGYMPSGDGNYDLGRTGARFRTVYATTGTINTSALKYKTNIKNLKYGIDDLMQLNPVSYQFKNKAIGGTYLGLIADDVIDLIPEVVTLDDDNQVSGMRYSDLIPLLIQSIKDLKKQIDTLK